MDEKEILETEENVERQNITMNLKKDELVLKIAQEATHEEVMEELKEKLPKLKNLYQEEKTPIYVVGKNLSNEEMDEIKKCIQAYIHL